MSLPAAGLGLYVDEKKVLVKMLAGRRGITEKVIRKWVKKRRAEGQTLLEIYREAFGLNGKGFLDKV